MRTRPIKLSLVVPLAEFFKKDMGVTAAKTYLSFHS